MNLARRSVVMLVAVAVLACMGVACGRQRETVPTTPLVTPLLTPTPFMADTRRPSETRTFDEHLISAIEHRSHRDLASALAEISLAEQLIEERSPRNRDYMLLLLARAEVYTWFDHLDGAEAALLEATGIPDDYVRMLSDSRRPLSDQELRDIAAEIAVLATKEHWWGHHVALSLIYNILRDTDALQREQQAAMDVSDDQDMTLSVAMGLYKVRGRKVEIHLALEQQTVRARQSPESLAAQYTLAILYLYAGWLPEAQEIIDRYLQRLDPTTDQETYVNFLVLKMNLEMSLGHYEAMTEYEAEILDIEPHAFDEFQQ